MNTLTLETHLCIEDVKIDSSTITIELSDGRCVSTPLVWYPRLLNGTTKERKNWELIGDGHGIHWPDLDEDLSMDGMLMVAHPLSLKNPFKSGSLKERRKAERAHGPNPSRLALGLLKHPDHQLSGATPGDVRKKYRAFIISKSTYNSCRSAPCPNLSDTTSRFMSGVMHPAFSSAIFPQNEQMCATFCLASASASLF